MATVTQTIGAVGRDFSTIGSWASQLDDTSVFASGDFAIGACYADTDFEFAGTLEIDEGGTIELGGKQLTAAAGQRHDGTADTGVRLLRTSGGDSEGVYFKSHTGNLGSQIDYIEIDNNETAVRSCLTNHGTYIGTQRCLVHGGRWSGANQYTMGIAGGGEYSWLCNNFVWDTVLNQDTTSDAGTQLYGIRYGTSSRKINVANTVYGTVSESAVANRPCRGIYSAPSSYTCLWNCISMGTAYTGPSTAPTYLYDFHGMYMESGAIEAGGNMSSDDTAPGDWPGYVHRYHDQVAADIFVSVTAGSVDLHLQSGTDAVGGGIDVGEDTVILGYTYPGPPEDSYALDIDGLDRVSEGLDWDCGADQFVASASTALPMAMNSYRQMART